MYLVIVNGLPTCLPCDKNIANCQMCNYLDTSAINCILCAPGYFLITSGNVQ